MGYIVVGMKSTKEAHIGDTFYNPKQPVEPLPGFKPAKPMVHCRDLGSLLILRFLRVFIHWIQMNWINYGMQVKN